MPEEPLFPLGAELLRLRNDNALSLRDAATRTGLNYTRIREWELGRNNANGRATTPPFEALIKLARAYGVKPEPLLALAGYTPCGHLSPFEEALLEKVRGLGEEQQKALIDYLENLCSGEHC